MPLPTMGERTNLHITLTDGRQEVWKKRDPHHDREKGSQMARFRCGRNQAAL